MQKATTNKRDGVVHEYFDHLQKIQAGDTSAMEKMLELWDEDGSCTFVGAPPLVGQFRGSLPLMTLFKNIAASSGMKVRAEEGAAHESEMGASHVVIDRTRSWGDKVVAEWTSKIQTKDGKSFTVAGSNTFTFKGDKIADMQIVISPRPGEAKGFSLHDLKQVDIGRLSLAAWAVV